MSWRSARPRAETLRSGQPRQKFAASRSRSAESVTSQSSKSSKDDVKAQLAKWQSEAKAKKSVADRKRAKEQHKAALLEFQYCVPGDDCSRVVQKFCSANQLSAPESVDLMKFVRYAKEKGLVQSSEDAKTLCSVWASKSL